MPAAAAVKRARAKPKTPSKPRKVASNASKGIKFRSRGGHKCTTRDGVALKGLHKAIIKAVGSEWDYDKCKANGTLKHITHPAATEFVPRHAHTKNERRLPYSRKQGETADRQITSVVKLHLMETQKVPLRAFVDAAFRDHWIGNHFGRTSLSLRVGKQIKRIRNAANGLLPEVDAIIRYLMAKQLTPVGAQTPVACGAIGTQCDLVVKNTKGEHFVCEIKCGCETNYTHGRLMPAPLAHLEAPFTTHIEHTLQTLLTTRCYRRTFPHLQVGQGVLLRSARNGLYVYEMPQWAKDAEQGLAVCMSMH